MYITYDIYGGVVTYITWLTEHDDYYIDAAIDTKSPQ